MPRKSVSAPAGDAPLRQGLLPGLLGYRLRLAQQAIFRDFADSIPDLSPGRVGVLVLIESNPGVTQSRLARAVGIDRSTLVGLLHELEARNLVQRRRGTDRRTNGLWLTAKGAALLARTLPLIARHEERVAAGLSASERSRLLALLGRLLG
ncbi:MAG: MarR family transcriptional regulator [Betaproteobacteria bacterium]|nr:MarR family transcriptional regulator [Betaproteobacteria bacterium]